MARVSHATSLPSVHQPQSPCHNQQHRQQSVSHRRFLQTLHVEIRAQYTCISVRFVRVVAAQGPDLGVVGLCLCPGDSTAVSGLPASTKN